jgi:hypothetical protein
MALSTIGKRLTQHSAASTNGTFWAIVSNGGQELKPISKGFLKMQSFRMSRVREQSGEMSLMMAPQHMTFSRQFHHHGGMRNSHPKKGRAIPTEPEIISSETTLM